MLGALCGFPAVPSGTRHCPSATVEHGAMLGALCDFPAAPSGTRHCPSAAPVSAWSQSVGGEKRETAIAGIGHTYGEHRWRREARELVAALDLRAAGRLF